MDEPLRLLTQEFLAWVAERPRTYGAVIEAWRTSCPRLPAWEDAIDQGLVVIQQAQGRPMAEAPVVLTAAGRAVLGLRQAA